MNNQRARQLLILALVFCIFPAFASNPGEPLDCSDWVFFEPGLYCTELLDCTETEDTVLRDRICGRGNAVSLDNAGHTLAAPTTYTGLDCGGGSWNYGGIDIVRFDGVSKTIVASLKPRCIDTIHVDTTESAGTVLFDQTRGRLLLTLQSMCEHNGDPSCGNAGFDYNYQAVVAIEGFPTLFDILQTYTPTASLGFRVPYMPEGFQHASFFDTYTGDLDSLGDFTQAQPLQCAYPASPPSAGDYLTVTDTLPDPAPGQGRYYVTAVNYQGNRRYGRQNFGTLTGRDPASLPACE